MCCEENMVGVDETQPMQQSQEVEQPQGRVQEREQAPEAEQAGQRAGAGQASSQALQEQIAQAVRPVLAEFHQHLAQAVRQEVDPVRKELQQEAQQARQPSRHEEQRAQLGPAQGQQRQEERRHTLDALQPRLRQLKLSGMHDAIVSRADEARSQGLDPVEFLALLLDDELARREAEGLARRIRQARFDEVCDLRDFDFSYNPEIPKARLWELASGRFIEEQAPCCCADQLAWARPSSPKPSAWRRAVSSAACFSPRLQPCSPTWQAGAPTAATQRGCGATSVPRC